MGADVPATLVPAGDIAASLVAAGDASPLYQARPCQVLVDSGDAPTPPQAARTGVGGAMGGMGGGSVASSAGNGAAMAPRREASGLAPQAGPIGGKLPAAANSAASQRPSAGPVAASSGSSLSAAREPHEERFNRFSEEWLQLLRDALPAALEKATADRAEHAAKMEKIASEAAAASAKEQRRREARNASKFTDSGGLPLAGGTLLTAEEGSMTCTLGATNAQPGQGADCGRDGDAQSSSGVGSFMTLGLDRLFSEQRSAPSGAAEAGFSKFRVKVPESNKSAPGVQFRKSKDMTDRYQKYARNGIVVKGRVEDDGAWLRLSDTVFLPMHVNGNHVLEAVEDKKSFWFACGHGGMEEEEEVLTNFDEKPSAEKR